MVLGKIYDPNRAGNIPLPPRSHLGNQRMTSVSSSQNFFRFPLAVSWINLFDTHDGYELVLLVSKSNLLSNCQAVRLFEGKSYGNREEGFVRQPHLPNNTSISHLPHELTQRRKSSGGEKLEIAEGTQ